MDASFARSLRNLFEVGWSRRYFILIPFLVSIPLSVIGSAFLPGTYVVSTLLLLQENYDDPLQSQGNVYAGADALLAARALVKRAEGLEALLKSERVLGLALQDIRGMTGEEYPETGTSQGWPRNKLAGSLSIKPIGKDFLEISLKGSDPNGMGKKLELITSRFLGILLVADRGPAAAVQVVGERRRSDLLRAKKAVEKFERESAEAQDKQKQLLKARSLKETVQRLESRKRQVEKVELAITEAQSQTGGSLNDPSTRSQEVITKPIWGWSPTTYIEKLINGSSNSLLTGRSMESPEVAADKDLPGDPSKIAGLEARREELKGEVDRLASTVQSIQASSVRSEPNSGVGKRLTKQLEEAAAKYQSFKKQFGNPGVGAARPLKLVGSPENIRVIDPPKDPKSPTVPRSLYIIAGIFAGFALGCSAAVLAEVLDQRLRRPEEFVAVLGAPLICRLPNSRRIDDPPIQDIESDQSVKFFAQLRKAIQPSTKLPRSRKIA